MTADQVKLTGAACRAARALLEWSAKDLVREAGVSPNTVSKLESGREIKEDAAARILAAFDRADVQILNGSSPGARLRPAS